MPKALKMSVKSGQKAMTTLKKMKAATKTTKAPKAAKPSKMLGY